MNSIAAGGQSNVIQFVGAQTRRLNVVDGALADYVKKINEAMQAKAGVGYMAIRSSLHGSDLDAVRHFLDSGVEPSDAVMQIMRDHGLKSVNERISPQIAGAYNKVQAAISEYVAGSSEWHRADDGRIYAVMDDTIALLRPVRYHKESPNEPEAFGFGIELREGAEVDFIEGTIVSEGVRGECFAGWDLAEPLNAMREHVASRDNAREFTF